MKRIAAPMVGGMLSSTILTLLIIPTIYFLWRGREVERPVAASSLRRKYVWLAAVVAVLLAAGARWLWPAQRAGGGNLSQVIQTVGDYQFEILGKESALHVSQIPVEIRAMRNGSPADVGNVSSELRMDMPGMPVRANAPLEKTAKPGVYSGLMKIEMQGEYMIPR